MLPTLPQDKKQRKLLKLFAGLNDNAKQTLLEFAEFLANREPSATEAVAEVGEPDLIPRPENETVVAAIKRLSSSYSMLNRDELLHETSDLMSSHILKGRPAVEVIDDLEMLFVTKYHKTIGSNPNDD